jgi:hypothetical protein
VNRRFGGSIASITQDLHGATSQKTAFFIITAVKTSNLIYTSEKLIVVQLDNQLIAFVANKLNYRAENTL